MRTPTCPSPRLCPARPIVLHPSALPLPTPPTCAPAPGNSSRASRPTGRATCPALWAGAGRSATTSSGGCASGTMPTTGGRPGTNRKRSSRCATGCWRRSTPWPARSRATTGCSASASATWSKAGVWGKPRRWQSDAGCRSAGGATPTWAMCATISRTSAARSRPFEGRWTPCPPASSPTGPIPHRFWTGTSAAGSPTRPTRPRPWTVCGCWPIRSSWRRATTAGPVT